jgi:hypothetical protein
LALAAFLNAARIVVRYEDASALNGLSQLNNTGEIKALKHIREIKLCFRFPTTKWTS